MRLPAFAVVLGALGLLPFAACGLIAISSDPVFAPRALLALVAYAAVILAFLGGVHWGFALMSPQQAARVLRARLGLGVVPSLVGWIALIAAFIGFAEPALIVLAAGFVGLIIVEAQAHRRGLMPRGYIWLRWGLTVGVLVTLVCVGLVHLLGGALNLTLD